MKLKKKKLTQAEIAEFEIKDLIGVAVVFVVLIIIVAYAQQITGDTKDEIGETQCADRTDTYTLYNSTADQCYNASGVHHGVGTYDFNSTVDGQEALNVIPNKSKTLITVIMASAIIGTLMIYLYYRFMKN